MASELAATVRPTTMSTARASTLAMRQDVLHPFAFAHAPAIEQRQEKR